MAMAERRLSWRDRGDVLPVDEDSPLLEVVQPQEQRRDGGLAGAAGAHEPDLLAGPDGQVEILDDAVLAPVMERDVLEPHLAPGTSRRAAWGASTMPCGRAMVCMLSCTTPIFSKSPRTDCITQPDMARMRITRAMPVAASPLVIRPRIHRRIDKRAGRDQQHAVHDRQHDADPGDEPERIEEGLRVGRDRIPHRRALLGAAGEELDGQDVGVAVDHPADEGRAGIGDPERPDLGARHEIPQQRDIGDDPEPHGQGEPGADAREQAQGREGEDRHVEQRVEDRDGDLADRRAALRDAVGQPPGEIRLEIPERVAERIEMGAPADHVGALRHQDLVGDDLVGEMQDRPHEQDRARPPAAGRCRARPTAGRASIVARISTTQPMIT